MNINPHRNFVSRTRDIVRLEVLYQVTKELLQGFGVTETSVLETIQKGVLATQIIESIWIYYLNADERPIAQVTLKIDWNKHLIQGQSDDGKIFSIDYNKTTSEQISKIYSSIVKFIEDFTKSFEIKQIKVLYGLRQEIQADEKKRKEAQLFLGTVEVDKLPDWGEDILRDTEIHYTSKFISEMDIQIEHNRPNLPMTNLSEKEFQPKEGSLSSGSGLIRILINEEPLTAYNLSTIISAITVLHTKFWLIQQQRFTEAIGFSQTHNPRFVEEANLLIGKMAHNSPGWLDFITANSPFLSEALKTVTTVMQTPLQLQATVLDNEAKELEMRLKEQTAEADIADKNQNRQIDAQRASLENQRGQLELEEKRLELMKKRLEIQEQQLDLEKKRVEVALEIAHKAVEVFPLEIDAVTKSMLAEILLPNILHLGTAKGAKLILSEPSENDESENAGGV